MKKDTILISTIVGLGATAFEIVLTTILKSLGVIKTPLYIYVGKLALHPIPDHPQWIETSVGIFGHLVIGVVFTFLFVLALQKWGDDYIYLKGLSFGGVLWVIHEVLLPNLITTKIVLKFSPTSQLTHVITALIWGLAAAYLYRIVQNRITDVRF